MLLLRCRFAVQGWRSSRGLVSSQFAIRGITTEADVKLELHDLPPYEFTDEELRTYNAAVEVINRIKSYGHPATYICGGWVRDKYLNRASLDIDITTSCDPNTVRRLFRRTQALPRNTVRVIHDDGRSHFEVTTFRGYSRNSDMLSACLDAEMRDFTMNALFYDTDRLKVMDFVGGVPDLQRRVLRLCRDPRTRLQEDPLRVVRGLRFATAMRFKLSPDTAAALRDVGAMCSPERGVPAGRIWKELLKMNKGEAQVPGSFMAALRLAFHLGFLQDLLPFLATEEALAKAVAAAEKLPAEMPLELRLAAMLHPSPNPDNYTQIAKRFMLGNAEQDNLETLHQLVELVMGGGDATLPAGGTATDHRRWVAFYAHPSAGLCLKVLEAWMPDVVLQQFRDFHKEKRAALEEQIASARQLREREEEAQRKAAQQRKLLSSRSFDPSFRGKTSPRVGDLLPPAYLQALVQKFNQQQATAAASPAPPSPGPPAVTPDNPPAGPTAAPSARAPSSAPSSTPSSAPSSATSPAPASATPGSRSTGPTASPSSPSSRSSASFADPHLPECAPAHSARTQLSITSDGRSSSSSSSSCGVGGGGDSSSGGNSGGGNSIDGGSSSGGSSGSSGSGGSSGGRHHSAAGASSCGTSSIHTSSHAASHTVPARAGVWPGQSSGGAAEAVGQGAGQARHYCTAADEGASACGASRPSSRGASGRWASRGSLTSPKVRPPLAGLWQRGLGWGDAAISDTCSSSNNSSSSSSNRGKGRD